MKLLHRRYVFFSFFVALILVFIWLAFNTTQGLSFKNTPSPIELSPEKVDTYAHQGFNLLRDLIQIPTIRGKEIGAVSQLKRLLDKEQIHSSIYFPENHPQRATLVAHIPSVTNRRKGLILMNHLDVVETESDQWSHPPFAGHVVKSRLYGRGAIDMKGMAVMELMALLYIQREKIRLNFPLMFLALADEESGGQFGARYLLNNHSSLFKDYGVILNEGGLGVRDFPKKDIKAYNIQVAEKGLLSLKLISEGPSGHGSSPPRDYASLSLVQAINHIQKALSRTHITPLAGTYFHSLADALGFPQALLLKRLQNPMLYRLAGSFLRSNRFLRAMTSNTVAITDLSTPNSGGVNVISAKASAILDLRLLPGFQPDELTVKIRELVSHLPVKVEVLEKFPSTLSTTQHTYFEALARSALTETPQAAILPMLSPGATDCRFFRQQGIACFGLIPALFTMKELEGLHGVNESLSYQQFKEGFSVVLRSILEWNRVQ